MTVPGQGEPLPENAGPGTGGGMTRHEGSDDSGQPAVPARDLVIMVPGPDAVSLAYRAARRFASSVLRARVPWTIPFQVRRRLVRRRILCILPRCSSDLFGVGESIEIRAAVPRWRWMAAGRAAPGSNARHGGDFMRRNGQVGLPCEDGIVMPQQGSVAIIRAGRRQQHLSAHGRPCHPRGALDGCAQSPPSTWCPDCRESARTVGLRDLRRVGFLGCREMASHRTLFED